MEYLQKDSLISLADSMQVLNSIFHQLIENNYSHQISGFSDQYVQIWNFRTLDRFV